MLKIHLQVAVLIVAASTIAVLAEDRPPAPDVRVGAAAVNLKCDRSMVLAGMIESRYTDEQEGELRATAVVIEKLGPINSGVSKLGIVECDVLWIPGQLVDAALVEIEKKTGIPPQNILINATHTHHAPSTAPAHDFGVSLEFCEELKRGIIRSVVLANERLKNGEAGFFFALGEEKTIGGNSRLKLADGNITWINPASEAGSNPVPTGPFDPQLPVLDFRNPAGRTRALIFNHSTHTIGTRSGKNVRSPGFYGLAAQELETELGGTVSFLEGASGSTHNISGVPVAEAITRLKKAVMDARSRAIRHPVDRLGALGKSMTFRVRHFNDAEEDAKIARYTTRYIHSAASSNRIRQVFAAMRKKLKDKQGEERKTYVQALLIGDVAIVGVPAEYFTVLGMDIKKRSPFKYTYIAELANDWIGYLPDREGHRLGGYQTWMGLHSYAEEGTGERVADLAVELLTQLAKDAPHKEKGADTGRKSPANERQSLRLADPNLTIELVAAEPDVVSPVAFAWDADGRLYVAEMGGYPVTAGKGRIKQLRDNDGDGQYEQSIVFADNLSFPATVMPYAGGILTIDAPDLLYLRDTDGDGKADVRRVEWTGFIPGSQQLRANALHWGLDNWISGANGRCDGAIHRPGTATKSAVSIRGRDFRFRLPIGSSNGAAEFESIVGQSQFGQCHDDWGHRFLSWNTIPIRQAVVPEPYATCRARLQNRTIVDLAPPDDIGRIFPISPPPRQFNAEPAEFYNAMCGLTIFRGDALGEAYRGNAFVGESLSNLVTRRVLMPRGVAFVTERAEQNREFLASVDPWFHPVFLATGPDGALYLADFYREYVEHPIYVASEETRKRIPWGHGGENGRIWRIRRKDSRKLSAGRLRPELEHASVSQLVAALSHPVGWWRETAQRLLVERQDQSAVPAIQTAFHNSQSAVGTIHTLWTLDGLGAADDGILRAALESAEPRAREQAIAVLEQKPARIGTLLPKLADLIDDPDAGVRFRLALALGALPADEVRLHALVQLLKTAAGDPWIHAAVLSSATGQTAGLIRLLAEIDPRVLSSKETATLQFLFEAGEQITADIEADELYAVTEWTADVGSKSEASAIGRMVLLAGIVHGLERVHGFVSAVGALKSLNETQRSQIFQAAADAATNSTQPAIVRNASVRLMALSTAPEISARMRKLLTDPGTSEIRNAVAEALAVRNDVEASRAVYQDWDRMGSDARRSVLTAATRSENATIALLEAVSTDVVRPVEVPIDVVERLKHSGTKAIRKRVAAAFRADVAANRRQVVEKYLPAVAHSGDPVRGAAVFRENCLACHTMMRFGSLVGPELSGLSSRPRDQLLYDILDPSARISTDFLNYVLVTQEGKTYEGLIVSQAGDSVRLRRAQGEEIVVPTNTIEQLRASTKSLMPEGFETKITLEAMSDLLAFLGQPSRDLLKTETSGPAANPRANSTE